MVTADGEYYLKIQTKDNAGNFSLTQLSPFHYRYDHTAPSAPTSVVSDPYTYSAVNSFNLYWFGGAEQTSNATSSGFLGFYYGTGTSSATLKYNNFYN